MTTKTEQVLSLRAEGKSTAEIAGIVGIAVKNVSALERSAERWADRPAGHRSPAGARSKLTDEQIQQLVRWRERGWSYRAIGDRLGVSAGAVLYQCLKNGVISPNQTGRTPIDKRGGFAASSNRNCRPFTAEEDVELQRLVGEGLRYPEIGRRMGRAYTSVRIRAMLLAQHEEIALARGERGL